MHVATPSTGRPRRDRVRELRADPADHRELLDPADAEHHPNANIITRAVGVAPDLNVETVSGEVSPGDHFVLASDGLTRLVEDRELAEVLASGPLDQAADRLIDMVLDRGAPDNVTVVIVKAT